MWRPNDWEKHFKKPGDPLFREVFELGADAILEALRATGFHIEIGQVLEVEGTKVKASENQTLVLIPDD